MRNKRHYEHHNYSGTITYCSYWAMKDRCYNPNSKHYENYGGSRGITVCQRWKKSFLNFLEDMGERPSLAHSLDRIDNEGSYCAENCKWSTKKEQGRNRRNNVSVKYKGKKYLLCELSEKTGISQPLLRMRIIVYGWPVERAILHKDFRLKCAA
jgi:hypothetical protein